MTIINPLFKIPELGNLRVQMDAKIVMEWLPPQDPGSETLHEESLKNFAIHDEVREIGL